MSDEQQSSWTSKMGDALGICTAQSTTTSAGVSDDASSVAPNSSYDPDAAGMCVDHSQPASAEPASYGAYAGGEDSVGSCRMPGTDEVHIYREGELRSSFQEHSDAVDAGMLDGAANPTNDHEMQALIDSKGGSERASDMSAHERLKFLANNGMAPDMIPPRHRDLMKTEIPEAAKESLKKLGQDVHNGFDQGEGNYNVDEYSVILDKLPDGMTPQEFMNKFLAAPNATASNPDFDFYNDFYAKKAGKDEALPAGEGEDGGAPGVGNWYHLDIPGNNGDVMIVDKDNDMEDGRISTTVQTMTDDQYASAEDHPVSGRRQFGLEKLEGGGYRFYTRGFDRAEGMAEDCDLSRESQDADWSALMKGVADKHGGRPEHSDPLTGQPVWGWHEHHAAEEILESGVQNQEPCELDLSVAAQEDV